MLNGILVYTREDASKNEDYIEWMLSEAEKNGMKLDFKYREDLFIGVEDGRPYVRDLAGQNILPNFAIVRCVDPIFTRQLEILGVKTFNSAVVSELCNDKAKTHQVASMLGIPMADTVYLSDKQIPKYELPYVVKNRNGRSGNEVFLIEDAEQFTPSKNQIGQKLATKGKDVRVFVIGKEIIGAIQRTSDVDFRANFSLGGKADKYILSETETQIVAKLINTFEFGFVGIDFVYGENGAPLLNEIEDVVGSRTLSKVTELNTVGLYLKFIKKTLLGK
ncbi:MAG: hypothetical protein K0R71_2255 [Bacillales bacterium]|nr:hypothetical protein [Bacillales bacterium]